MYLDWVSIVKSLSVSYLCQEWVDIEQIILGKQVP